MRQIKKEKPMRFRLASEIRRRMAVMYFGIYLFILALLFILLIPPLYKNADAAASDALNLAAEEIESARENVSGYANFLDGELASYLKEYRQNPSDTVRAQIELILSTFTSNHEFILTATLEDFDHNFFRANYYHNVVNQEFLAENEQYQALFEYSSNSYYAFYDSDVFSASSAAYSYSHYAMGFSRIQYFNAQPYVLTIYYDLNNSMRHLETLFDGFFSSFAILTQKEGVLYTEGSAFADPGTAEALFEYGRSSDEKRVSTGNYYYCTDTTSNWIFLVYSPNFLLLSDVFTILGIITALYLISPILYTLLLVPIINRSLNPLNQLYRAMKHYTPDNPGQPLEIRTGNEIQGLSDIYNHMVAKISQQITDIRTQEHENAVTNYKLLSTQIDPHFIYNTMNIINVLARQGKDAEIVEINSALIKILRERLNSKLSILDTLEKELDSLYQYQRIMQYRYGDRINLFVDVDSDLLNARLPKNILQPLAENSFYHGFADLKEGETGNIELLIYESERRMVIELSDNGAGMSEERIALIKNRSYRIYEDNKPHIGLDNIRQRLSYVYGDDYQFDITSCVGYGTTISITVPL